MRMNFIYISDYKQSKKQSMFNSFILISIINRHIKINANHVLVINYVPGRRLTYPKKNRKQYSA